MALHRLIDLVKRSYFPVTAFLLVGAGCSTTSGGKAAERALRSLPEDSQIEVITETLKTAQHWVWLEKLGIFGGALLAAAAIPIFFKHYRIAALLITSGVSLIAVASFFPLIPVWAILSLLAATFLLVVFAGGLYGGYRVGLYQNPEEEKGGRRVMPHDT